MFAVIALRGAGCISTINRVFLSMCSVVMRSGDKMSSFKRSKLEE